MHESVPAYFNPCGLLPVVTCVSSASPLASGQCFHVAGHGTFEFSLLAKRSTAGIVPPVIAVSDALDVSVASFRDAFLRLNLSAVVLSFPLTCLAVISQICEIRQVWSIAGANGAASSSVSVHGILGRVGKATAEVLSARKSMAAGLAASHRCTMACRSPNTPRRVVPDPWMHRTTCLVSDGPFVARV